MSGPRRIGLFGGTFDPVHAGHLDLATACLRRLRLHAVRFVVARRPPHKEAARATSHHRHAMVALATAGHLELVADPRELERGGPSYTVETLGELERETSGDALYFLAGADSLRDLDTWRRPREILARAVFVAVGRSGVDLEHAAAGWAEEVAAGRVILLEHEPPPWSSTELRQAIAEARVPDGALAPSVLEYVAKHGLYGSRGAGADPGARE